MNLWQVFYKGLFEQNPIFRLALSLCPALAVTSTVINSLAMGLSVMFVITANNCVVSVFRKFVNPKVRVPVYITFIATIVTLVQLTLAAFFPILFKELSIYLALIVVFAIILARAEVFAAKNTIVPSFFDGLGMGAGFTGAMLLIGVIRELFGAGTIAGIQIMPEAYNPALIMILPPGGFILIGLMIASFNIMGAYQDKAKAKKEKAAKFAMQSAAVRGEA
jgi:electron transport complex protein RnfE